jgi:hypothetical protein
MRSNLSFFGLTYFAGACPGGCTTRVVHTDTGPHHCCIWTAANMWMGTATPCVLDKYRHTFTPNTFPLPVNGANNQGPVQRCTSGSIFHCCCSSSKPLPRLLRYARDTSIHAWQHQLLPDTKHTTQAVAQPGAALGMPQAHTTQHTAFKPSFTTGEHGEMHGA